jgi:hypothetical protein
LHKEKTFRKRCPEIMPTKSVNKSGLKPKAKIKPLKISLSIFNKIPYGILHFPNLAKRGPG